MRIIHKVSAALLVTVAVVASSQGPSNAAAIPTMRISIQSTVTHVSGTAPGVAVNDTVTIVATIHGTPTVVASPDKSQASFCFMYQQDCTAQQWNFADAQWTATFRRGQTVVHSASGILGSVFAAHVPASQNRPQRAVFYLRDQSGHPVLEQEGTVLTDANGNFANFAAQIHQSTTFDLGIYDASFPTWFTYQYDYTQPQNHALIDVETFQSADLSFDAMGGSGTFDTHRAQVGAQAPISSTAPVRAGHVFLGWNTASDGSGTMHQPGGSLTVPPSGSLTLFAQWRPNAPEGVRHVTGNKMVTLRWSEVPGVDEYTVSTTDGTVRCVTVATSCRIGSLRNGKAYTFQVASVNSSGVTSVASSAVRVIPGFTVRTTAHKVRTSPKLTSIITTASKGTRTWTVRSGSCRITAGRLVLPSRAGTCRVRLAVASRGRYAAMSTTVTVTITR